MKRSTFLFIKLPATGDFLYFFSFSWKIFLLINRETYGTRGVYKTGLRDLTYREDRVSEPIGYDCPAKSDQSGRF